MPPGHGAGLSSHNARDGAQSHGACADIAHACTSSTEAAHISTMSDYETILAQFRSAQENHAEGRFSDALALYDAILAAKPDLAEVYSNRGVVLRDLHRFDEALQSFNKAIEINPVLGEAYNNKGHVLTELGRLGEALATLDQALQLKPDFADAYNNRG